MSQSRFSIVLVGVSALLRRPLVSRLRPADGERSPWVVFTARRCLPFRRLPLGGLVLPPSVSTFSARWVGASARRVGLRAHCFRFSARTASELPLGELVLLPSVSEIAARRVGASARRVAFGLTTSAFRHAPLRGCPRRVGASAFRFGDCCSAGWPSGSPLPLFGMRRSAPPCRRSEGRRSTPTRHLFHFKTLIPTC